MRYGDKEGYNEIYDAKGELTLHPNEKILVVEENNVPSLKSTWRYYGGDYLLEPSKGNIYLTNERLVFINIPERMFAIGGEEESRAMSSSLETSFEIGDLSPGAAIREYFEVPTIEIMASERKEGAVSMGVMVNVYILSSGNQYHLSMVLNEDSDLLKRLMNKRVQSLDELVNNLKDYFQRTDWMFNDAEKKLFKDKKDQRAEPQKTVKTEPKKLPVKTGGQVSKPKTGQEPKTKGTPSKPPLGRPVKVGGNIEKQSQKYFENLYKKGLIKDDIYKRLMSQFGATSFSTDGSVTQERSVGQEAETGVLSEADEAEGLDVGMEKDGDGISEAEPLEETPSEESKEDSSTEVTEKRSDEETETDEELLGLLNDTLSDFDEEGEEQE